MTWPTGHGAIEAFHALFQGAWKCPEDEPPDAVAIFDQYEEEWGPEGLAALSEALDAWELHQEDSQH